MTFAIRLLLDPVLTQATEDGPTRVAGFRLSFTPYGPPPTKAKRDTRLSATIDFIGRFTATVRDHPSPEEKPLGTLTGEIELSGSPPRAVFLCDPDSLQELTKEPDDGDDEDDDDPPPPFGPKALDMLLADGFDNLDALDGKVPRLFLPPDSGQFRYLEVVPKLSVDGGVESDVDTSDILDVLIGPDSPDAYPFSL